MGREGGGGAWSPAQRGCVRGQRLCCGSSCARQVLGAHGKAAMLGNEGAFGHRPWGRGLWSSLCRMEFKRTNLLWVGLGWIGRGQLRVMDESWVTWDRPQKPWPWLFLSKPERCGTCRRQEAGPDELWRGEWGGQQPWMVSPSLLALAQGLASQVLGSFPGEHV